MLDPRGHLCTPRMEHSHADGHEFFFLIPWLLSPFGGANDASGNGHASVDHWLMPFYSCSTRRLLLRLFQVWLAVWSEQRQIECSLVDMRREEEHVDKETISTRHRFTISLRG